MRIARNPRKPLLVPLTPLVVAAFFALRGAPAPLLHASQAAMAAVAAVGTYLMTLRPAEQRLDMAEALTGRRPADPLALLPVDAASHWLPAGVLAWDLATGSRPRLSAEGLGLVAAGSAALTAAYVGAVDSAFMYQLSETALVGGFMAVYLPFLLLAAAAAAP